MPDLQTSTALCTFCPRLCSDRCPVSLAEARETVTPQAKMARLHALRRAPAEAEHDGVRRGALSPLPLYACTGCGACTDGCLHRVEPALHLLTGRSQVEARHPALRDLPRRQRARAQRAAADLCAAVPEQRRRPDASAAYLPPCLPAGGAGPAEDAARLLRIADRLPALAEGGPVGVVAATSACAGYPLYAGGFAEEFRLQAEVFAREVAGHDLLLVGCPGCAWLLRTQYAAHGVPVRPRVLHVAELLGRHAEALPVRRRLGQAVYHDPCHLGRRLGVYDEPRAALGRAFAHVGEFADSRGEAACAGGGALLPLTAPDTAAAIARERLAQLPAGAEVVVTACPSCQRQLGQAAQGSVQVLGLLEALEQAL